MKKPNEGQRRASARKVVLSDHGEEMLALIRYHVGQCPACAAVLCTDEGMRPFLDRLDAELKSAAQRVLRTGGPRPSPRAPRPEPRGGAPRRARARG